MTILGLTGGIGSGKSTVSRLLASHGFEIIDADLLTRRVHRDPAVCAELAQCFGADVIDTTGNTVCVNRPKLAAIVFNSADALSKLNNIMQPALYRALQQKIECCKGNAVLDAALLFEAGWDKLVSQTIVVLCPIETRIQRIVERDHLPIEQIRARIAAQMDDSERIKRADYLIYNVGNIEMAENQVQHVITKTACSV